MDVNSDGLLQAIRSALLAASTEAASIFEPPANSRAYGCGADGCTRPAYAKGLCNAHYIRQRAGRALDQPVRARKREGLCATCGKASGAKGGWGLCQTHYRAKRNAAIKDAVIRHFGGKCQRCKKAYPRTVFDLHHLSGKTESPSSLLQNSNPEAIARELSLCLLLCANCHRIEHANEHLRNRDRASSG